ncbi:FAD-dependent monooxygenase [Haloferula sp. BvORR071]|uniref:NAD(P)/FAD-dependent oxidoreductase n=1 Tax=Haloferula sp. BvORR071 TaxID=1396141 RepID=UPI002240F001|nr:FAD-dependent monooxygenase [Haloferula sp. BvORR071]
MKDTVTIAGGGLAGLSLASGLRLRGVPVTVHEAGSYPRHRVCGEFISGVSADSLDALGIRDVFHDARLLESVAWFSRGRKIHSDSLPEPAYGISRYRLDERLRDLALEHGAVVHEKSRLPREPVPGQVWATGRRPDPLFPKFRVWMGLKCHFQGLPLEADLEMHLGRDGYIGLARIEDGRVNVCGLFLKGHGGRLSKIELLLDYISRTGNEALVKRLRAAEPDLGSFLGVADFKLGERSASDDDLGLCEIGDADRMIPPFTGNGMSMAFQGAELALDPLERWSSGRISWDECRSALRSALDGKFHRRMQTASLIHPLLLRSAYRRLIESLGISGLLPFRPLLSLVR